MVDFVDLKPQALQSIEPMQTVESLLHQSFFFFFNAAGGFFRMPSITMVVPSVQRKCRFFFQTSGAFAGTQYIEFGMQYWQPGSVALGAMNGQSRHVAADVPSAGRYQSDLLDWPFNVADIITPVVTQVRGTGNVIDIHVGLQVY